MDTFVAIIIPMAILVGLAAVFGTLLAVLGKKLAVAVDEREEKIASLLAGANCGACGYPGCAGFAKALVEGRAEINMCAPTSPDNKEKIGEVLGVEVSAEETKIVVCCAGGNESLDKYSYMGYGDCRSMELIAGGRKECPWGCLGMGSCSTACGYSACKVDKACGYAVIDKVKCVGCGACIVACPKGIIKRIPAAAKVYVACSGHDKGKDVKSICKKGCIACTLCVKNCPEGAIHMEENLAVIDYDKCTGCGKCVEKCPAKCIVFTE